MNAYNTKVEGVMPYRMVHWSLLFFCLVLAPSWNQVAANAARPSLAIMNLTKQKFDDRDWRWLSQAATRHQPLSMPLGVTHGISLEIVPRIPNRRTFNQ